MHYDLIIVGGGLIGTGLAVALRDAGLKIALIDASLPKSNDPRLFALTSSSCQFLKNLQVWEDLSPHATAIHQVHVSYQKRFGAVRLRREEVNLAALGHVIPACYIEAALNAALTKTNIECFRPASLQTIMHQNGEAIVTIKTEKGETQLVSPLVIGADGTQSTVRSQANIATKMVDYGQSAIVTRTRLMQSHHHVAYERFLPTGAIAMLPLMENECGTIWTDSSDKIAELKALSEQEFLRVLQKEFGYRLGRMAAIGVRYVFPLRMTAAEKNVAPNILLLGNAAHTLHPIAAQGFNLGLYEVATLVENILQKKNAKLSFDSKDLANICQQTERQQTRSMTLSHRLSQLFNSKSSFVGLGLQCGMIALDIATPVKQKFIKQVIGMNGRVPQLLLSM